MAFKLGICFMLGAYLVMAAGLWVLAKVHKRSRIQPTFVAFVGAQLIVFFCMMMLAFLFNVLKDVFSV